MLILTYIVSAVIGTAYFFSLGGNSDIDLWLSSSWRKWSYDISIPRDRHL